MFVRKIRINKKYINKINRFESFLKNQFRMCFFLNLFTQILFF